MMVEDGDAVDLLQQPVVRFLEVSAGQGFRLGLGRCSTANPSSRAAPK